MSFSVAFWNVENFHGRHTRAARVERHIRELGGDDGPPDLFALCEVKDKTLMRDLLFRNFADYDFAMSDTASIPRRGRRSTQIELLVGWRRGVFDQVMYTQRIEVTGGRMSVRPGVLVNVRKGRRWWSVLFLHTKSGPKTESFNARQKQFNQVFRLKRTLDNLEPGGGDARYIVVGDLNTMGNGSRGQPRKISGPGEVRKLASQAGRNGMRMEAKEFGNTFNQRSGRGRRLTSNLDHVLTSDVVRLRRLGRRNHEGESFTVNVSGWNQLEDDVQALHEFEDKMSDHSAMYFVVRT